MICTSSLKFSAYFTSLIFISPPDTKSAPIFLSLFLWSCMVHPINFTQSKSTFLLKPIIRSYLIMSSCNCLAITINDGITVRTSTGCLDNPSLRKNSSSLNKAPRLFFTSHCLYKIQNCSFNSTSQHHIQHHIVS